MTEEWMYVCPDCEQEIVHDHLLRVERVPSAALEDADEALIRITYRHCGEIKCTAYVFELSAVRRLFPGETTVMMPWPRVNVVSNGIAVPIDFHTKSKKSAKELLMERTLWELEQLNSVGEFLLYCRGPLQPEELRKDTANEEPSE